MTTQTPDPEQAAETQSAPKVSRPRWKQPEPSPEASDPSSPSPDPSSPAAETAAGSDAGPDSAEPSEPRRSDRQQSGGSSRTSSRAELRQAVRVAFAGATTVAHELLVRDEYARHAQVLLADEQDLDAIAEPGANLIARRIPKDAPLGGDLADIIALAVGAAGYLLKQVSRARWARQMRDGGASVDGFQPELESDEPIPSSYAGTFPADFPIPE